MVEALEAIKEFTGNSEIPAQTVLTFLHISLRSEVPMADLIKLTGVSQASVSRNVARLAQGLTPDKPGAGLIEVYEDPYFRSRKLARLTSRGRKLVEAIGKRTARYCGVSHDAGGCDGINA
jgi:DNA-binding MarR family transcriptional regulator